VRKSLDPFDCKKVEKWILPFKIPILSQTELYWRNYWTRSFQISSPVFRSIGWLKRLRHESHRTSSSGSTSPSLFRPTSASSSSYLYFSGKIYRAFHRFSKTKFLDGGFILGSNQFWKLPQLPPKILLNSKVVKIDPKIIISLC